MPPRNRTPMYAGEGLDREQGLMVVRPVDFRDLRNVLLHEGSMQLRTGFTAAGEGQFEEVDRLVAGFPLKSDGLGIVVGYNETEEKVYVYRVAPDLSLVELLGEWVHDLSFGWGSSTPRIIMCEVNGRVFMAHDESRVTRRAPTLYYDPITGEQLLNYLTATFAGTSEESAESGAPESESVVVVPNAIRFRGVVRHLQYLVGWGFGTATEIRPELVRVSLPGEPLIFDVNHYFVAGDRRDPVLACGPSGDVDGAAAVLTVWKRSETHAITGYDRATFGIQLIDPRHGIVSSRAWVNIEGFAVAWAEEGPRIWQGLAPSESLELPLGLDAWEPDDLPEEGGLADAFAHYVPRERVAWFHFGRRVYALTARVKGRWRWSYQTLGFDAYGAFTLFETTEEKVAPEGYPSCDALEPAGTFIDITVGNHLQAGDETIEVWIRELNEGSGGVTEPSPGVFRAATNFGEFPVGSGLPAGMSYYANILTDPALDGIAVDGVEGNYYFADPTGFDPFGVGYDAWDDICVDGEDFEALARIFIPALVNNRYLMGPACRMKGLGPASFDAVCGLVKFEFGADYESEAIEIENGNGLVLAQGDWQEAEVNGVWVWHRFRFIDNAGADSFFVKTWTGDLEDEPVAWDAQANPHASREAPSGTPNAIGWAVVNNVYQDEMRIAYMAWTTDPINFPPLGPDDIPPVEGPWSLVRSVAVTTGAQQEIRITGLNPGQMYEIALRYRRGLLYNAGAENTDDPSTWPSVSRCETTTTVDPPTIESAVWERTSAIAEQITLTITPATTDDDIELYVAAFEAGPYTLLDTIAGPHAAQIEYDDVLAGGEVPRYYKALTASGGGDSPLSDPVFCWAGPAAIPVFVGVFFISGNYIFGFSTTDATLETELYDTLVDPDTGENGPFELEGTAAAGETEVSPDVVVGFDEDDDVDFFAYVRHKKTTFGVEDFGQQSVHQMFSWPEGA